MSFDIPYQSGGIKKTALSTEIKEIPAGASGTILEITPTTGKRAILTFLMLAGASTESGISVDIDNVEVIPPSTLTSLGASSLAGTITIGSARNATKTEIRADVGEKIQIKKDAGSTSSTVWYAYSEE